MLALFIYIDLFSPHTKPGFRWSLSPFYRWENQGSERLGDLLKEEGLVLILALFPTLPHCVMHFHQSGLNSFSCKNHNGSKSLEEVAGDLSPGLRSVLRRANKV